MRSIIGYNETKWKDL